MSSEMKDKWIMRYAQIHNNNHNMFVPSDILIVITKMHMWEKSSNKSSIDYKDSLKHNSNLILLVFISLQFNEEFTTKRNTTPIKLDDKSKLITKQLTESKQKKRKGKAVVNVRKELMKRRMNNVRWLKRVKQTNAKSPNRRNHIK